AAGDCSSRLCAVAADDHPQPDAVQLLHARGDEQPQIQLHLSSGQRSLRGVQRFAADRSTARSIDPERPAVRHQVQLPAGSVAQSRMSIWTIAIFLIAGASGAVATLTGFGIGSLLTPLLASQVGTKTAVAAVAVPHLVGTTIRFWRLRHHIDRRVLWRFGIPSAAGGLAGALLHAWASSPGLAIVFGALLILAGLSEMTGMAER